MAIHVHEINENTLEDLRATFFADNVKLVKKDCLSVRNIENHIGTLKRYCDSWHLLYMPSKKCFRFTDKVALVPLFCDDNMFIVHEGEVISTSQHQHVYTGQDVGIVNTGSYSLTLVGK
tara:strand:+ start:710 stop:1066 length:357 start_codon:yes stop_codon:yes gene_type:complete